MKRSEKTSKPLSASMIRKVDHYRRNPPRIREEADGLFLGFTYAIIGGVISAPVLLPTIPWLWVIIGAILIPVTWVRGKQKKQAMMIAADCNTIEEWNAFYNSLPRKKQLAYEQAATLQAEQTAAAHQRVEEQRVEDARQKTSERTVQKQLRTMPRYELKTRRGYSYEVVGEAYRERNVIAALGGLALDQEKTIEDVPAFLIPEPDNPYGNGHAIMVWINDQHVGYLGQEDAERFSSVLSKIYDLGYLPTTRGRVWGVARKSWDNEVQFHLYARVRLGEPESLIPTNEPPTSSYSMLPDGAAIQVSKESDYLPQLIEHLHGPDSYAIATLRTSEHSLKNGTVREIVTVHIDGEQIGELTPTMSEKILPAIRHLNDLEYEAAAWARIKGSRLAVEVAIYVAKAHEIPDDWLTEIPVTLPRLNRTKDNEFDVDSLPTDEIRTREENWDF